MNKEIIEAVDKALKDHGVDWILNEKYPTPLFPLENKAFDDLMKEIELALDGVL